MYQLTDQEKDKIYQFNEDEVLQEAVKKVLLSSIYANGTIREGVDSEPLKNGALGLAFLALSGKAVISDEALGQDLRALAHGINQLEAGFKQLLSIKREVKEVETPYNEAI